MTVQDSAPQTPESNEWTWHPHMPMVFNGITPLPLDGEAPLSPFPTEVFPPWLRSYVELVAWSTQTPVDFAGMMALATLSCCTCGQVVARPRTIWQEPLNLFLVVVASPGERKSAVLRHMIDPITAWQRDINEELRETRLRQEVERDALIAQLQALKRKATAEGGNAIEMAQNIAIQIESLPSPRQVTIISSDITPERAVVNMHRQHGALAILSAEGEIFGILTGRYSQRGNVNIDPILKGHAGDPISYDRQDGTSIFIPRPALTMGIMVQPHMLETVVRDPFLAGRGLLARLLFARPASMVGRRLIRAHMSMERWQQAQYEYSAMIRHLLDVFCRRTLSDPDVSPFTLTFEDDAEAAIARFELLIEARMGAHGDLKDIKFWAAKLCGATVRIAGLLHLAEHGAQGVDVPVSCGTWQNAERLASYFIEHAIASLLLDVESEVRTVARDVVQAIRAQRLDRVTRTDIYRWCPRPWRTSDKISTVIDLLVEYGYLAEAQPVTSGRGRPPMSYLVHPAICTDDALSFFADGGHEMTMVSYPIADGCAFQPLATTPSLHHVFAILRRVRAWDAGAYIRLRKTLLVLDASRADPPPDDLMQELRTIAPIIFVALCHTERPQRADFEFAIRQIRSVAERISYSDDAPPVAGP